MKQIHIAFFIGVLSCLLFVSVPSCKSNKIIIAPDTVRVETKIFIRDTILIVKADSSQYKANLTINKLGEVSLQPLESKKGQALLKPNVAINKNILTVSCEAEAQKIFFSWKEKYVKEHVKSTQLIIEEVEKDLSFWQKGLMWTGGIFLILATLVVILKALKINI